MGKAGEPSILHGKALQDALRDLPGWRPVRHTGRLLAEWRFREAEDAASFVFAIVAAAFDQAVFPEVHWLARSVTAVLSEPGIGGGTPPVLALARRLSNLGGPPSPHLIREAPEALRGVVAALRPGKAEEPLAMLARVVAEDPTGRVAQTLRRLQEMLDSTEDLTPVPEPLATLCRKRLASLPGWEVVQGGTVLKGSLSFSSREAALDFIDLGRELVSREAWPVTLSLEEPAAVRVAIRPPQRGELTERDFDAADALERLCGRGEKR